MYDVQELQTLLASLHNSLKLQSALLAKFEQREASMRSMVGQSVQALQDEVSHLGSQVKDIVDGAAASIADDAKKTLSPIATGFGHDVSTRLQAMRKTLSAWGAAGGAILVLTLLCGWLALGHYRQELAAVREELRRHEDAIPVLRAYAASDATLCGGLICVNINTESRRLGDRRQYRQARPRPAP
jgi:hypothetical protein